MRLLDCLHWFCTLCCIKICARAPNPHYCTVCAHNIKHWCSFPILHSFILSIIYRYSNFIWATATYVNHSLCVLTVHFALECITLHGNRSNIICNHISGPKYAIMKRIVSITYDMILEILWNAYHFW